jgi:hypothetical protein
MSLDQLATVVDQLTREFKSRQTQLQPIMNDLRVISIEFVKNGIFHCSFHFDYYLKGNKTRSC